MQSQKILNHKTHKCSICDGSGKTDKYKFRFPRPGETVPAELQCGSMMMIPLGRTGPCPGCAGEGISRRAKILNGDLEPRKSIDINALCQESLDEHPKEVERFRDGKEKVIGKMIKYVLTKSDGCADPKEANEILRKLLIL